jgi:tRNA uridine 5-carboxymethylaminomethyl modification enzyme
LGNTELTERGLPRRGDGAARSVWELLSLADLPVGLVAGVLPAELAADDAALAQARREALYDVFAERQKQAVEAVRRDEALILPTDLAYDSLSGLSNELKHKLRTLRPRSIGHAARIEGMTPAALTLLMVAARRHGRRTA